MKTLAKTLSKSPRKKTDLNEKKEENSNIE